MMLIELYTQVGGDYEEVKARLMKDERIVKYLKKFADGSELEELKAALADERWEDAFRAAHTLKGVSANLGLNKLAEVSSSLCEELRAGVKPANDIRGQMSLVEELYNATGDAIGQLQE